MAHCPTDSPLLARALERHAGLTQAHEEAVRTSAQLNQHLSRVFQVDVAETQRHAINIGTALQRVARAERACGECYGVNHNFSKAYGEMLQHHRCVFMDFERLSHELETNLSPRCSDIAALAADIERHLNLAEEAHHKTFGIVSLPKSH